MTIHAEVRQPITENEDPTPTGWWVRAVVSLEREPRSPILSRYERPTMDLRVSYDTLSPQWTFSWRGINLRAFDFLMDSGSEVTQLGSEAIAALGLTVENTMPLPEEEEITEAGGGALSCRAVNGELWIQHLTPTILGHSAYSAFRVVYIVEEAALLGLRKTDSLIGQDILDYLITYGGMFRRKPSPGRPTPIVFDISPNWRLVGRLKWESPSRFPHDASTLAARKRALNKALRRVDRAPPT